MNRIYIIHCWGGTKDDGWYPWLDKKISDNDNQVIRFNMPDTENPKINTWVKELEKQVDVLDENTYFVGHSIGCQTILRYLENQNKKIGGILLVAPWLDLLPFAISDEESYDIAYPWLNTPINFDNIKKLTNNITCIFSDNDYFVSLNQKDKFMELLGAQIIIVNNKGHISCEDGIFEPDDIYYALIDVIHKNEEYQTMKNKYKMTKYILKPYTDEDYEFVYNVKKNAYKKYVEECWGKWIEDDQREYFKKFIDTYKNSSYIIVVDDVNIGFFNDEELLDGSYEIGNICIIPKYQGHGIGTMILKDKLEEHKNQDIKIQFFKQNPVGRLYKRLGFIESGDTKFHYQMIKYKNN